MIPTLGVKEAIEAFKPLYVKEKGGRWHVEGTETHKGKDCIVVLIKRKDVYPVVGPKHKSLEARGKALDKDGKMVESNFGPVKSSSWKQNRGTIFPEINAWCELITGENPNFA